MRSLILTRYNIHNDERIVQGDIYRDIPYYRYISQDTLEVFNFPYIVVLTQDCDLEQDFDNRTKTQREDQDKCINSILICPAYLLATFRAGTHLQEANIKMRRINSEQLSKIKSHQDTRYHYLHEDKQYQVPELVIDFKHYHTIPRESLYEMKGQYLTTINEIFREHLSQRFANYFGRIGLPTISDTRDCEESKS